METSAGPIAAAGPENVNSADSVDRVDGAGELLPLKRVAQSLPLLLSSFIGREREIAELKGLLADHRLLTLTGPGGSGKSRLALAVAAELAEAFDNRIYLVELAALAIPSLVPQALAAALEVRERPERTSTESLVEYLRGRRVLLLLDNCEHLIAAVAALADALLRACPQVAILATSREALAIGGEIVWPVPSLSWPDPERLPPLDQLEQYDAVRLFVDRATAVLPTFRLTQDNARALAQVCQRLDGIPLALELAAARMSVLSLEQMAARLEKSVHVLKGGNRTALPRQQTLRATIDWSYDLLSAQERMLLQRLSVFAGGFTLEAVEAVCAGDGLDREEVLDFLTSLVAKSLVAIVEHGDEVRHRLLETVRQYAQEKLEQQGSSHTLLRQRHASYFLELAQTAEPKLRSAERTWWLDRLARDHENLRAALQWAREQQDSELALRLAGSLGWFWYFRGSLNEGREWLEAVLAVDEEAGAHPALRAKALWSAGALAWVQGDYAAAHVLLDESLTLWRAVADEQGLAHALTLAGLVTGLQGDHTQAYALQEESLELFRRVGDQWGLALALYWQGDTLRIRRDHAPAQAFFEESLGLFHQARDQWGMALALQGLGAVAYRRGNHAEARSRLEEALVIRQATGDKWLIAQTLSTLALTMQQQGDYRQAEAYFEQSLALYRELGDGLGIAHVLRNLAEEALRRGERPAATAWIRERLALAERGGQPGLLASALISAAGLALSQQQLVQASRLFAAAEQLLTTSGETLPPGERARADEQVAAVRRQLGDGAFAAAWSAGQAMPLERILGEAFLDTPPLLPSMPQSRQAGDEMAAVPPPRPEMNADEALHLFALGRGRVYRGDHLLTSAEWSYARVKELLFYLLCSSPSTKERIGLDFWPDASPAQLRRYFHDALYHLRRALGRPEWILFEHGRYAFNSRLPFRFDVQDFEAHLAEARRLRAAAPAQAIPSLEAAIALYQGDFLEDAVSGEWHLRHRDALRRAYLEALLTLGQLYADEGRYAHAADAYRQLLARDVYQEAAHRALMRCYARQGERGQALLHYQRLAERMRDELGVPPAAETRALFEALSRGDDLP